MKHIAEILEPLDNGNFVRHIVTRDEGTLEDFLVELEEKTYNTPFVVGAAHTQEMSDDLERS